MYEVLCTVKIKEKIEENKSEIWLNKGAISDITYNQVKYSVYTLRQEIVNMS